MGKTLQDVLFKAVKEGMQFTFSWDEDLEGYKVIIEQTLSNGKNWGKGYIVSEDMVAYRPEYFLEKTEQSIEDMHLAEKNLAKTTV